MIYNEIRPEKIEQLYGKHLDPLRTDIKNNKIKSAYLFHGLRGSGKSSSARLLKNYLPNCKLVGINASSESTKKDAEKLIAGVNSLGIGIENKIILVEEIHKASAGFQNAILTPLENPAPGVHWILCTTEVEKVIDTIRSRCKKIAFKPLSKAEIGKVLEDGRKTCSATSALSERVVTIIYKKCEGSARDALTELECISDTDDEAEQLEILQVIKPDNNPSILDVFYSMWNGKSRNNTIKLANKINQENPEGVRRVFLKLINNEINKCSSDEDAKDLLFLLDIFNERVYNDFIDVVHGILKFYHM